MHVLTTITYLIFTGINYCKQAMIYIAVHIEIYVNMQPVIKTFHIYFSSFNLFIFHFFLKTKDQC
jgi:hypothetical protein